MLFTLYFLIFFIDIVLYLSVAGKPGSAVAFMIMLSDKMLSDRSATYEQIHDRLAMLSAVFTLVPFKRTVDDELAPSRLSIVRRWCLYHLPAIGKCIVL